MNIMDDMGSYVGYRRGEKSKLARLDFVHGTRARLRGSRVGEAAQWRMHNAFLVLNKACVDLMIGDQIRDRAAYLYRKYRNRGATFNLIATCLLVAVRESEDCAPLTIDEIAKTIAIQGHNVTRKSMLRMVMRCKIPLKRRSPESYVPRIHSLLMNDDEIQLIIQRRGWNIDTYSREISSLVRELLQEQKSRFLGCRPFAFVCGLYYLADRLMADRNHTPHVLTQRMTARITKTSENQVRALFYFLKQTYPCQRIGGNIEWL